MSTQRNKSCPNCSNTYYEKDLDFDSNDDLVWLWHCTNCSFKEPVRTRKPRVNAAGRTAAQQRVVDNLKRCADSTGGRWTLKEEDDCPALVSLKSDRLIDDHIVITIGKRGACKTTFHNPFIFSGKDRKEKGLSLAKIHMGIF